MEKILLVYILSLSIPSMGQVNLDSLWGIWNDPSQSDTIRLSAIDQITNKGYMVNQPDSACFFAQLQYDFAKNKGLKNQEAKALKTIGISFYFRGEFNEALDYYNRSSIIYKKIGNKEGLASISNNTGIICSRQGDISKAINHFTRSLTISEEIGDKQGVARGLINIGNIHLEQESYNKALDYYNRSIILNEEIDNMQGLANTLNNIGQIYFKNGDYKNAISYQARSLAIREEIGDKHGITNSLTNIGDIYFAQGETDIALDYHNRSLIISKEIGDKLGIALSLTHIGTIYKEQNRYSKAIDYCSQALFIAQEIGAATELKSITNTLYETYKATGQSAKALEMYELFIVTKDKIESVENRREVIRQEFKHAYEKQSIVDRIAIAEADAQIVAQQAKFSKEKVQRYSLFGGLIILLIFIALIYDRFRKYLKQEKKIESTLKELRVTQSQLVHSGKMAALGQLTAGIAHEINNPIGFIKSSSFAMEKDLKDILELLAKYRTFFKNNLLDIKEIKDFEQNIDVDLLHDVLIQEVEDIKVGIKRTTAIVKGLQEFSFKDSPAMAPANLHNGINITLKILNSRFNHNIQLIKEFDPVIVEIFCHIGQLNQVFMNLLINALDAIGENKGDIIISTKNTKNAVVISVKDNGTGIPNEIQDKIFDPFFTTKKQGEGTGLGLSISHGIIENHKGSIKVLSEEGKGSNFIIKLPILARETN